MLVRKAAVLGAGTMGSRIAAHLANCGIPVLLLDIVPSNLGSSDTAKGRNAVAQSSVDTLLKAKPAAFYEPSLASLVTIGNFEDDLPKLADCDWIVEAIIENVKIKHDLYAKLETVRKEGSIVSSNTSTIPLRNLIEGRSDAFQRDFAVTHFFNPPRYMRLLELVSATRRRPT